MKAGVIETASKAELAWAANTVGHFSPKEIAIKTLRRDGGGRVDETYKLAAITGGDVYRVEGHGFNMHTITGAEAVAVARRLRPFVKSPTKRTKLDAMVRAYRAS